MKFSIEKIKNFNNKVTITISYSKIKILIKKEIINIRKTTTINGFRKNKTPIQIIYKKYGKLVEQNVLNNIMKDNFKKIVEKNQINIIDKPEIDIKQYNQNSDLIYSVYFKSIPNIDLNKLKLININKLDILIDQIDVEKTIENIRNKKIIWTETALNIKKNDRITANYYIIPNKEEKDPNKIFTFTFIKSKNNILPELEKQFFNKKTENSFIFQLNIPKYHPEIKLRNKKITIKITIKKVENPNKIYSKSKFIQYLLKKFKIKNSIQDLYVFIKQQIEEESKKISNEYFNQQIIKKINKLKLLKISNTLIKQETNKIQNNIEKKYITNQGNILESEYWKNPEIIAKQKLYTYYIIQSIIYQKKIQVKEIEIKNIIKNINKINKDFIKNNKYNLKKYDTIIHHIKNMILENKINSFFLKNLKISTKKCNFREAIKINNTKKI